MNPDQTAYGQSDLDLILSLHPSQQFFSYVRTSFPGLNQY